MVERFYRGPGSAGGAGVDGRLRCALERNLRRQKYARL